MKNMSFSEKKGRGFSNDYGENASPKRLTGKFVDTDKAQMTNYIKDLEKTIRINKEIMSEFFSADSKMGANNKKTIEKLNQENTELQVQLKKAIKERDDAQASLLINEQINENNMQKEKDLIEENEEKLKDIQEELEFKEYELQFLEKKYNKAEAMLKRYASRIPEINALLKDLSNEANEDKQEKISNVVEENEALAKELLNFKIRMEELEIKYHDLEMQNKNLSLAVEQAKLQGPGNEAIEVTGGGMKFSIPRLDFSKVRRPGGIPLTDSAYEHKLEEIIKNLNNRIEPLEIESRVQMQKIMQLENTNNNLINLNTKLSKELQKKELEERLSDKKTQLKRNSLIYNKTSVTPFNNPFDKKENAFSLKLQICGTDYVPENGQHISLEEENLEIKKKVLSDNTPQIEEIMQSFGNIQNTGVKKEDPMSKS